MSEVTITMEYHNDKFFFVLRKLHVHVKKRDKSPISWTLLSLLETPLETLVSDLLSNEVFTRGRYHGKRLQNSQPQVFC